MKIGLYSDFLLLREPLPSPALPEIREGVDCAVFWICDSKCKSYLA